ncbi:magnesium transporter [Aerococcus kribbianus]|uniref:Magnesium transporter MgtE n=1 Tax=Aerococcus kribbianus TaxID=2999064 RepID=A0A9X3JFK3_9LACT|nr:MULTISPECIES: magnesium transporter [unclassified Aerococcus]MCZ0717738.1 magnesium transporter [Aerococcus sp. YH-aer221]MCZ0726026.1 magnesium transporter [Aerococcus sp. YH-aer222]
MTEEEIQAHVIDLLAANDREGFREEFLQNHSFDQAQMYLNLDPEQRQKVHHFLTPKELSEVYDIIDEEDEEQIFTFLFDMDDRYAANLLSFMYTDNAVDILNELSLEQVRTYMRLMPKESADDIKSLMNYADETAGAIMTTEFVSIKANQTVKSAMTLLRAKASSAETIYYLYVVDDDNRLVGVLSLRDLIISQGNEMVYDLMSDRIVAVDVKEDQNSIAKTIKDYDFLAIPVIEETGELIGIVTVDDIIDVIDDEATQDYSGLAGVDVDEQYENPLKSSKSRLPWLITLLFLGMGTSTLISQFEDMIAEVAILSIFITLITGTAGNAGTQSLAVAVRRLATPDDEVSSFFDMVVREITTGLISGAITGFVIFAVISVWRQNIALGLVIGIAMLAAITVANLAGSLIPILMDKLGFDPAVASGPFITTLSDLTSVLIYFSIASYFMPYLQ